jgi:hypothetical protein
MSCELNVIKTSPGWTPALSAGDPGSTFVTIGYLSKNAAPLSFSIAWSEILTPNHPDGISTDAGDGGGCVALCAIDSPGSANDAIMAAAT